jgi:hypothetical protein
MKHAERAMTNDDARDVSRPEIGDNRKVAL